MVRRRIAALALVAVGALGAGCSLGEKQQIADRAADARAVGDPRVAVVELGVRPVEVPAGAADVQAAAAAQGGAYAGMVAMVEPGEARSTLLAPPAAAARIASLSGTAPETPAALLVADRTATVVRRPARDVVAARAWYRLELDRANEVTKPDPIAALTDRGPSDLAVLTPTLMTDLLAGVLAGSVEEDGDTITGRLSIDKANREDDLDDDAIESREQALRLFAITDDVHEFELRLADDGSIAQLVITMRMRPNKQTAIDLLWGMTVQDGSVDVERPPADAVIRISSFNQARGAIASWTAVGS